jgi:uncharacterized repeat protein (TIGR03803 family)
LLPAGHAPARSLERIMIRRTLSLLLACAAAMPWHAASAASLRAVYQFSAPGSVRLDAANPYAGLVRDAAGTLYGTLYAGGAAGAGGVFMLVPQDGGGWAETLIHSFSAPGTAGAPPDGAHPLSSLILGPDGVLYGTTSTGGGPGNGGGGTVFALHPPAAAGAPWTETVLTVFPGGHGGGAPAAHLRLDASGALYGTTTQGGTGAGSVFRLTPPAVGQTSWTRTDLHVFGGAGDGQTPISALVEDEAGDLYGTTQDSADRQSGAGTVYRLTPPRAGESAWTETILFNFPANGAFGSMPNGDLLMDKSGTLYGTASAGGARGAGTVFRLGPQAPGQPWRCTVLYHFTEHAGDAGPQGGVIFGRGGALLGTTANAARHQQGTVFQLIPGTDAGQSWSETVLARFPTRPAGGGLFPVGDLVPDGTGDYFGVTEMGGAGGVGTVFAVRP